MLKETKRLQKNHTVISTASDVQSICNPLLRETPIETVLYGKMYDDGTTLALGTLPSLFEYAYNRNFLWLTPQNFKQHLKPGWYLYSTFTQENEQLALQYQAIKEKFHFSTNIIYFTKSQGHYLAFGFYSSLDVPRMLNFYMNNLQQLEQFTRYFEDHAQSLLQTGNSPENRLYLPHLPDNMITQTKPPTITLPLQNSHHPHLTPRERECLSHIAQGHSCKSAAALLGISNKTVEWHYGNAKMKMNVYSRQQAIKAFLGRVRAH